MKNYITTGLLFLAVLVSSCNKWLDLKSETLPNEDQILNSPDGFRAVLNGLYRSMGSAQLYGKDLTFGLIDCISQQYKLDHGYTVTSSSKYIAAGKFEYQSPDLNPAIGATWLKAFNVIANANNLIQKIETKPADFFLLGNMEKNMILGEAMAARALVHFDMLRIFAPALVNDDGGAYVPYADAYPTIVPTPLASRQVLDKIVADLEQARRLVAEWDTSEIGGGTLITGEARFYKTFSPGTEMSNNGSKYDDFLKGRGYRLHYYAITALLSRVHNYRGEHKKAFDYAKEVMDYEVKNSQGMQKAFALDKYTGASSTNWDTKNDIKTVSNLIFAIHNAKAYYELDFALHFRRDESGGAIPTWFVINKDAQKTFETREGVNEYSKDYRARYLIYMANGLYPISGKYFISVTDAVRDKNAMVIPVIRSSELRYIMAEYYARNGDFGQAKQILTSIRTNRGLTESLNINNWEEFQEELIRDARREYISEGQLFYLYKRLNASVDFGKNQFRPLTRAEYLLPIPGNTIN